MNKLIYILTIITLLLIAGCSNDLPPEPETPGLVGEYFRSVGDWATAPDKFQILSSDSISCALGDEVTLSYTIDGDDLVYSFAYLWNEGDNSWDEHLVSGSRIDSWVKNKGDLVITTTCANLLQSADDENELFVVAYSCSRVSNTWDCDGNRWQLEISTVIENTNPDSCSDNDVSDDISIKGRVNGWKNGIGYIDYDVCSGDTLTQVSCVGTQQVNYNTNCDFGCVEGTCMVDPNSPCTPGDAGCGDVNQIPDLISYWNFDEGTSGTLGDLKGSNDGSINGASWASGIAGGALSFDGIDDYVDLGTFGVSGSQLTISAWVKPSSTVGNDGRIISKASTVSNQRFALLFEESTSSSGKFQFRTDTSTGFTYQNQNTLQNLDGNTWYHVVGVYDGSQMRIYLDGVLDASVSKSGSLIESNEKVWIGGNPTSATARPFKGAVDEVMIFNRALDQSEINTLFDSKGIVVAPDCTYDTDCGTNQICNAGTCENVVTETCYDGIQNQGETGIDCGGPCGACAPVSSSDLLFPEPAKTNSVAPNKPYTDVSYSFSDVNLNSNSPEIYVWNKVAKADESITLLGTKFTLRTGDLAGTDTQVYVGTFVGNNLVTYQAKVWSVFEDKIIITIPEELPEYDVFYLWIKNEQGISKPVKINSPDVLWTGPMDNVYDSTKETIRVFGKELTADRLKGTSKTNVYLKSTTGTEKYSLPILKANPYDVEASLSGVAPGNYNLYVHKGEGAQYGWSNPIEVVINNNQWTRGSAEILIRTENQGDDTLAIQNAINTLSGNSNGGTVRLGAGDFTVTNSGLSTSLQLKKGVRIVGAGKGNTVINFDMPGYSATKASLIKVEGNNWGLEDLSVYMRSGYIKYSLIQGGASNFLVKNVDFDASDNVLAFIGWMGYSTLGYGFAGQNGEIVGSTFTRQLSLGKNVWFHDNTFLGEPYMGREKGMEAAIEGTLNEVVIENNLFDNSNFDGDAARFYQGDVTSATSNTVNFAKSTDAWQVASLNELGIVSGKTYVAAKIGGVLHYRKISSYTSNSITIEGTWPSIPTTSDKIIVQPSIGSSKIIRRFIALDPHEGGSENFFFGYNKGIGVGPLPAKTIVYDSGDNSENKGELILFHGGEAPALAEVTSHSGLTSTILADGTINGRVFPASRAGQLTEPTYLVGSVTFHTDKMDVFIVDGKGKGQIRRIDSVRNMNQHGSNSITVTEPWTIEPDSTSIMRVGYTYHDNIIYENEVSTFIDGERRIFNSANSFISLDGQSSFNSVEGNNASQIFACTYIGGEVTSPSWFNELRGNSCTDLISRGSSIGPQTEHLLYWDSTTTSYIDLISPVVVGNTRRNSFIEITGPRVHSEEAKADIAFIGNSHPSQIGSSGLGEKRNGVRFSAPMLVQFGNIVEKFTTIGGQKGIEAGTYSIDLFRNNEIQVDSSVEFTKGPTAYVTKYLQPVGLYYTDVGQKNIFSNNNYIIGDTYPDGSAYAGLNGYPFYPSNIGIDNLQTLLPSIQIIQGESIQVPISNGGTTNAILSVTDNSNMIDATISSSSIGYGSEVSLTVTAQNGITPGNYYVTVSSQNGGLVKIGVEVVAS